ncbi:MAG: phosphoadenosine phosphosulfate reductase family protein [Myxococcota bacterium]
MYVASRPALGLGLGSADDQDPEAILASAFARFDRLGIVSALGPQTLVVIDLVHRMGRQVPVRLIDTGMLFPETYGLVDAIRDRYGIAVERVHPTLDPAAQAAAHGPALWARDPDACCAIRKVAPLEHRSGSRTEHAEAGSFAGREGMPQACATGRGRVPSVRNRGPARPPDETAQRATGDDPVGALPRAVADLDGWITGLRRDQAPSRALVQPIAFDARTGRHKVCPLVGWTRERTLSWLKAAEIPYNPLLDQGYRTVGCVPCSRPASADDDPTDERAGRWAGRDKTECGLHGLAPRSTREA